jgi:hypothetical protein
LRLQKEEYPLQNDDYWKKISAKQTYSRGFRPPYTGGLHPSDSDKKLYIKDTKSPLSFKVLYNKVSKTQAKLSKDPEKDIYKEYANKKSIKEVTLEMMEKLETDICNAFDEFENSWAPKEPPQEPLDL